MKPLLLILLLVPFACFGQKDSTFFDGVYSAIRSGDFNYVKNSCKDYVNKNPQSNYKVEALYLLGGAYHNMKKDDSAVLCYNAVLSNTDKQQQDDNFRHNSAYDIAGIFIDEGKYDKALIYLDKAENKFPFRHFCGNAYAGYYIDLAVSYSQCYKGKREYQKAIDELQPHMMQNGLADNTYLVDSLFSLYLLIHSKDDIRNEFAHAATTITVEKKEIKGYSSPQIIATTIVFGKQIHFSNGLDFDYVFTTKPDTITDNRLKKEAVEIFKQSHIYNLATH